MRYNNDNKLMQFTGNFTTNQCGSWMHIRCKFDDGKQINKNQSGSGEGRCTGVALRQNPCQNGVPQCGHLLQVNSPMKSSLNIQHSTL